MEPTTVSFMHSLCCPDTDASGVCVGVLSHRLKLGALFNLDLCPVLNGQPLQILCKNVQVGCAGVCVCVGVTQGGSMEHWSAAAALLSRKGCKVSNALFTVACVSGMVLAACVRNCM